MESPEYATLFTSGITATIIWQKKETAVILNHINVLKLLEKGHSSHFPLAKQRDGHLIVSYQYAKVVRIGKASHFIVTKQRNGHHIE